MEEVDNEWELFMLTNPTESQRNICRRKTVADTDADLKLVSEKYNMPEIIKKQSNKDDTVKIEGTAPSPSPLHISTKTSIAHLTINDKIDVEEIFWNQKIISYNLPLEGIIKKQYVFKSTNEEELNKLKKKLSKVSKYKELVLFSINDPNGCVKFRDKRDISIGLCKKQVETNNTTQAFENCLVLIMRLQENNYSHEYHIKVFNSGKIEIPGVKDANKFNLIMSHVVCQLRETLSNQNLSYTNDRKEAVLLNSNFNCGYNIDRVKLARILRTKYKLMVIFDPCIYPGNKCRFSNTQL